jgi:hypothetical protein
MAITQNPASVYVVGLGSANINYMGGGSVTAYAVTAGSTEPFADQEKITVNGDIKTFLTKNQGTRYNLTCYIASGTSLVPPVIGTRIDIDFHASGTDLNGILTAFKIDIADTVAVLNVTLETVSGLTFT